MKDGKSKRVLFWIATGMLAFGMTLGGIGQLAQAKFNTEGMIHLGYPLYLLYIIGSWKMVGVIVILSPGLLLLKEWAYAGFFFLMTGAVISHLASGDSVLQTIAPFVFACLTVVSWYLRPADRRLNIRTGFA